MVKPQVATVEGKSLAQPRALGVFFILGTQCPVIGDGGYTRMIPEKNGVRTMHVSR